MMRATQNTFLTLKDISSQTLFFIQYSDTADMNFYCYPSLPSQSRGVPEINT